jgi:hypothetical protein
LQKGSKKPYPSIFYPLEFRVLKRGIKTHSTEKE